MSFIYKPLEKFATYVSAPTRAKYAYALSEGTREDKELLSIKGASLCELTRLGYHVPPAFILSTEAAVHYRKLGLEEFDESLMAQIQLAVSSIEKATDRQFGSTRGDTFPLLLSLRGGSSIMSDVLVGEEERDINLGTVNNEVIDVLGAPDSWCFPGIKESCLGIGLTDVVVEQIAGLTSRTFAYNAYAHFLIRYGTIVLNVPKSRYRQILSDFIRSSHKTKDELSEEEVFTIHQKFKEITPLPQDPMDQLFLAIKAMYSSWFEIDAALYRQEVLNMPFDSGLALIVQTLVMGDTGIAFSRNPATGELDQGIFGCIWKRDGMKQSLMEYAKSNEKTYQKLIDIARYLELQYMDMVQMEYVVDENDQINLLQVLPGRRTPNASIRIAVDLKREKILNEREAVLRINAKHPTAFWRFDVDSKLEGDLIGTGQTSSRGIAVGAIAFNAVDCLELQAKGLDVVLIQRDADSADERLLSRCAGLVLLHGDVISPPAALCRALGKPCITGVSGMKLTSLESTDYLEINEFLHLGKGDHITMNAGNGKLYRGTCNRIPSYNEEYFKDILQWAEKFRAIRVDSKIVDGDLAKEVARSNEIGADNIGHISTDFMFRCTEERLTLTRQTLVAKSLADRRSHLNVLQDLHEADFIGIIRAMLATSKHSYEGHIPLGVKLLDTSLGVFLREKDLNIPGLAIHMNVRVSDIKEAISVYHDENPDIGLRGCRITAIHPEITEMQLTALFRAVFSFEPQLRIKPHIWIPAVSSSQELRSVILLIESIYRKVFGHKNEFQVSTDSVFFLYQVVDDVFKKNISASVDAHVQEGYTIGVILDNPRACLRADTMIDSVRAFGIDLRRLTSHVFGCTQGDAMKLFPRYVVERVYQVSV